MWYNDTESLRKGPEIVKVPQDIGDTHNMGNKADLPIYLWYRQWGFQVKSYHYNLQHYISKYFLLLQEVGAPHSYIITCPLPTYKENKKSINFFFHKNVFVAFNTVPIAVSLVENECDTATNILSVFYEPLEEGHKKQEIAICVRVRKKL